MRDRPPYRNSSARPDVSGPQDVPISRLGSVFVDVILLSCVLWMTGCFTTTRESLIRDELTDLMSVKILEVTLENGVIIQFDEAGGHFSQAEPNRTTLTMIIGNTADHQEVQIDVNKILSAKIERIDFDIPKSLFVLFVGIPSAILLIVFGIILFVFLL